MPEARTFKDNKSDCAREPIHVPGAIQPHGYLFILNATDLAVIAVSQNTANALATPAADMIGRPVTDFLASTSAESLSDAIGARERAVQIRVRLRHPDRSGDLDGVARSCDGLILLEFEASTSADADRAPGLLVQVRSAIEKIRESESTESACDVLAAEVRRLSGFERVMVYRFDGDWNGQVVAEDRDAAIHSYAGHAFPASDIPAQARALYLLNTVRIIPDARYKPSPIYPHLRASDGEPFDLSGATLRSVSPVHLEYLANMGVAASMSVSIIRDNRLWGLVACHHSSARRLPQSVLQACDLLAQAAAWYLDTQERTEAARCLAAVRRLPQLDLPGENADFRDRLKSIEPSLLALTRSEGMAICDDQGVWAIGRPPPDDRVLVLAQWLSTTDDDRVTTDGLSKVYPPMVHDTALASGISASRLGAGWLIWFRAEWPHTLTWAGKPNEDVRRSAETSRINPRRSFASWRQKVRGRSLPWSSCDLSVVDELQVFVLRAIMADQMLRLTANEHALIEAKLAAEAATRTKSSFLAQMSHEIRTPLNGVLGMAQVMAADSLTPAQRDRLTVIEKSGAGLLTILNDILDLSKIEAGRLELEEAPFEITEVAADIYAMFESTASAKGISFLLDVHDDVRGVWRGDAVRVRQLISNLVSNALKFTSHGEVKLTVGTAMLHDRKCIAISVADTGIGVPTEAIPRLFEPFAQADSTTTRRFGGTGLGLTICRQIIEQMGGSICVQSEVGKGTVFDVELPLAWKGAKLRYPGSLRVESGVGRPDISSLRVLAADDNETNRIVLKAVLDALGVQADIVEDGQLAIDAWSAGRFDLVLMDVEMPVLGGVLATAQIRRLEAERGLPRTPIVAFSANAMSDQVVEYLAAGFDAHLAKPIAMAGLCEILESVAVGREVAVSAPSHTPTANFHLHSVATPAASRRATSPAKASRGRKTE